MIKEYRIDTFVEQLKKKIDFYKSHEFMLPFVGEDYKGILQVGESHYIEVNGIQDEQDKQKVKNMLLNWTEQDPERENVLKEDITIKRNEEETVQFKDWVNTRGIISSLASDWNANKEQNHRKIYTEFLKAIYGEEMKNHLNYNQFAFMNFFIQPASNSSGGKELANDKEICKLSSRVLEEVIKIIKPRYIIFTSCRAYDIFIKNLTDVEIKEICIRLPHPTRGAFNRERYVYDIFNKKLLKTTPRKYLEDNKKRILQEEE